MNRLPFSLYGPIDGDWAKWNVEAILHFSKIFDLSPYNMLAGMGSMYLPNLPWLNPGALALALPLSGNAQNIASYAVYAAELAASIVLLARVIGFSWLMPPAAAQLYLYLMFPPFREDLQIYPQYTGIPYYAHLTAVLNAATAVLLACGRTGGWRRNVVLCIAFLVLFVSGLLSAPISFIFAAPAYIAVAAVVILARRPPRAEWAWKAAALLLCPDLLFRIGASVLLSWNRRDSRPHTGLAHCVGQNSLARCLAAALQDSSASARTRASCYAPAPKMRGWKLPRCSALRRPSSRDGATWPAAALIAYIGFAHIYAYAYQAGWLGSVGVLSTHFLMVSCWVFVCMFAVVPFFALFRSIESAYAGPSDFRRTARLLGSIAFAALLLVIAVNLLRDPYAHERYRPVQLLVAAAGIGIVVLILH